MLDTDPKIIVALDFAELEPCLALVSQLEPSLCRLKVGKEMFTRFGPELVTQLHSRGFQVFLDLKFHDIPNTVAKAVEAAASLGVWMVNVHASGGLRMMSAAREALDKVDDAPKLIAVTVLTSMNHDDLQQVGVQQSPAQQVTALAQLSAHAGLDGVVCSAQEATAIKTQCGQKFLTVTPGIRPAGSDAADQRRIMTPAAAVAGGADYLVVGRPVTQAASPMAALHAIADEIQQALN